MNKIIYAILMGVFVAVVVLIITLIQPFEGIKLESVLNIISIAILTILFSLILNKFTHNKT